MKWGEFKRIIEQAGVKSLDEIDYIDLMINPEEYKIKIGKTKIHLIRRGEKCRLEVNKTS
jgi:hypothetical protein